MFQIDAALIRRKLAESDLTAKEFAERAGLNALTVARLIKGDAPKTSIKIVGRVARALGVDSEKLIVKGE